MTTPPTTFEEFWPYYVSQHQDPTSRKLHFVGTTLALSAIAASPLFPPLLAAAPIAGYGCAWVGHFVFEKNVPATFGNPLWSLRGDMKMYKLMWQGKMDAEVEKAREVDVESVVTAARAA